MKVSELMIGNWVKCGKRYMKVTQLAEDMNCDDIEPIPLTPEILYKNGFSGEGYNMGIVGFSVEPIPDKKDGYEVFIWKDMCLQIEHGFTHFKKYIKYVHQLQNAIHFCEIEKEIEL